MTIRELREVAKQLGIKNYSKLKKPELEQAIAATQCPDKLELPAIPDGETVPLAIHQDRIVRCYKDDTPLETLKRLIHEFEKTQEKYAKFGAHDTEPDAIFQQLLVTAARQGRDRVPREAKGWDLYTCSMDCSEAGAALTAKADEIVKFILSLSEADRRIIGRHLKDYCWRM